MRDSQGLAFSKLVALCDTMRQGLKINTNGPSGLSNRAVPAQSATNTHSDWLATAWPLLGPLKTGLPCPWASKSNAHILKPSPTGLLHLVSKQPTQVFCHLSAVVLELYCLEVLQLLALLLLHLQSDLAASVQDLLPLFLCFSPGFLLRPC